MNKQQPIRIPLVFPAMATTVAMSVVFIYFAISSYAQSPPPSIEPILPPTPGSVVINEIMWMGSTQSSADEWVELSNTTLENVNIGGWTLSNLGSSSNPDLILDSDLVIAAAGYILISNYQTDNIKSALNDVLSADQDDKSIHLAEGGEQLILKDSNGNIIDQTPIADNGWPAGQKSPTKQSMERDNPPGDGLDPSNWHTCTAAACLSAVFWDQIGENYGTPRSANTTATLNHEPAAAITGPNTALINTVVSFDATNSTDPDGDDLTFNWFFDDGTTATGVETIHTFNIAGTHTITLTVTDNAGLENETIHTINITVPSYSDDIVINELLPNPAGSDSEGEFIELANLSNDIIDLQNWQLTDGSKTYTFPADTSIGSHSYLAFYRPITGITLNNNQDTVRLLDPLGSEKSVTSYSSTIPEGHSWNRTDSGNYQISTTVTPGSTNVITANSDGDDQSNNEEDNNSADSDSDDQAAQVAGTSVTNLPLNKIRQAKQGTVITTIGVVSVQPGILGDTIFYLAGSGIQIYFSQGEFPALKIGDKVSVIGELSSIRGEARLKISQSTDVKIIGSAAPPIPHQIKTGEVGEDWEGSLITIAGTVASTSGDTFYVDDGSGQIKIFIKSTTGINKPKMKKGMAITITGIVSETSTGYRILPRFQKDIITGSVALLNNFPSTGWTPNFLRFIWLILAIILFFAHRSGEPLLFTKRLPKLSY